MLLLSIYKNILQSHEFRFCNKKIFLLILLNWLLWYSWSWFYSAALLLLSVMCTSITPTPTTRFFFFSCLKLVFYSSLVLVYFIYCAVNLFISFHKSSMIMGNVPCIAILNILFLIVSVFKFFFLLLQTRKFLSILLVRLLLPIQRQLLFPFKIFRPELSLL